MSALVAAIEALLGEPVSALEAVRGGDVGEAFRVRLGRGGGASVFAKTVREAPAGALRCEAEGLQWLADAKAVRTPEILGVLDPARPESAAAPPVLVLEWIEPAPPAADHDERLGRELAALHSCAAPHFGAERDNFIGPLPQSNARCESWGEFYAHARLAPLLRRARDRGLVGGALSRRFDTLLGCMAERVGPVEPPARLHGDLWSGNALCDESGRPVLIDPAAYGGHREVDLAMMHLFGGFSQRVFDAYEELSPLAPGAAERLPLYQLYPLLVHVVLFGEGYLRSLSAALDRCG